MAANGSKATDRAIIVGAGQAAAQCAISLRQFGWRGEVLMIGAEETLPYQRPPLTKAFLAGEMPVERLLLREPGFYEARQIRVRSGETVIAIDRRDNVAVTSEGEAFAFAKLFLATGTRPRQLEVPGVGLNGVGYIRDVPHVRRLHPYLEPGAHLVVVGGGFIGLEVAAVARKRDMHVTVVEAGPRLLGRVTDPIVSRFYEDTHRARGVDVRLGATIMAFEGDSRVRRAHLQDGTVLRCDMAVIGIGVVANDEVAMYAGLEVEPGQGIVADETLRTSDPAIYAIGDCALAWNASAGRHMRIESVANAIEQARIAAAHACGLPPPERAVPWFWSDQYELKLQTAGLPTAGYDQVVVRGERARAKFAVYYLRGSSLVAVDAINSPPDFNMAKRLIGQGDVSLDPARIADTSVDVRHLAGN